jgi:N6-adenosine-specific RNA methylase IME4
MGVRDGGQLPKRESNKVMQVLLETPKLQFSRKPDEIRRRISDLYGEEYSKIELFARVFEDSLHFKNWSLWGNEITKKRKADTQQISES